MKQLKDRLENYQIKKEQSKITNPRQLVIKDFLDRLNPPRVASGFPPVSPARIGMLLAPLKTIQELRDFYAQCNDAKDFSKFFWWKTNPKKHGE